MNIHNFSALKNICPDKTRRMQPGKQEAITFVLTKQKKHVVFHKSIYYFKKIFHKPV